MFEELNSILDNELITSLYQPIIDKFSGDIFAYEALSRGPSNSILHPPSQLFEAAQQHNLLNELDLLCRQKAVAGFVKKALPGKLFINVSPQSLLQHSHQKGKTLELLQRHGLEPNQVVIELTEHHPSHNEQSVLSALRYYQEMGFAIALDDLGAGYSSLRLWSQIKPEFVKIDRHFIESIDTDNTKQEFVRSFVELAESMQCKIIAEGVETLAEFEYLCKLKIDYFQGYYFSRPMSMPPTKIRLNRILRTKAEQLTGALSAGKLAVHSVSVSTDKTANETLELFLNRPNINSIAVVDQGRVLGIIHRSKLLNVFSKPFGRDLYSGRSVLAVMEQKPLLVDSQLSIDQVSRLVTSRARYHQEDDFIICHGSSFVGVGHVIDLLKQVTELQIKQARHSNPLTQMPGLIPINDCQQQLLENGKRFIVSHFDIDNFKPFNDVYGFSKGDEVILALGQSLKSHSSASVDNVGHIGGDDFIVLWNSEDWRQRIEDVVDRFSQNIADLYRAEHVRAGGFNCEDRYGQRRFFPLATISVACLEVDASRYENAFDISSALSPLKAAAKQLAGHSIAVDSAKNVKALGPESVTAS